MSKTYINYVAYIYFNFFSILYNKIQTIYHKMIGDLLFRIYYNVNMGIFGILHILFDLNYIIINIIIGLKYVPFMDNNFINLYLQSFFHIILVIISLNRYQLLTQNNDRIFLLEYLLLNKICDVFESVLNIYILVIYIHYDIRSMDITSKVIILVLNMINLLINIVPILFILCYKYSNRVRQYVNIQITPEEINILPTRTASQTDLNKECNICLMNYNINDNITVLPCIHEYHEICIEQWIRINRTCPVCRYYIQNI